MNTVYPRTPPAATSLVLVLILVLTTVTSGLLASPARAQQAPEEFRVSQWGSVAQKLARTTITVEYYRPIARGRSPLFGGVVHWGEIWTPGANEATILELSADATVEGHQIPAGRWSVWMIPSEVGPWELLLDPRDTLFHTQRPEPGEEGQIRFDVRTEPVDHVEVLTWSFPRVDHNRGTLRMAWGSTSVPLEVEVESAMPETVVSAEDAALYAGEWTLTLAAPPGQEAPPPVTFTVWHGDDGSLMGRLPPDLGPPSDEPAPAPADEAALSPQERERAEAHRALREQRAQHFTFMLVPFAEGIFRLGFIAPDGRLLDVENFFFEFDVEGEGPPRLDVRDREDRIVSRGERGG